MNKRMKTALRLMLLAAALCLSLGVLGGAGMEASSVYYDFDISGAVRKTDEFWINSGALAEAQVKTVKLTAVGDLMVHGRQAEDALRRGGDTYDYDHSFSVIKRYFSDSDIVCGNLETVLAGEAVGYNDYPLFSVTDEFLYALKGAGFSFLSTANNHCLDRGAAGLLRTIDALDAAGISHAGTYASQKDRDEITLLTANGMTFAVLSYTYGTNGIPVPTDSPYMVNLLDEAAFTADIAKAKALEPDFIIVFPHMGNEYETFTRQEFRDIVMAMFKAGADVVLASHPHVLQPAEFVTVTDPDGSERTCFAAYSLGNFISGQRTKPREAGVIFNLYFEKAYGQKAVLKNVSFIPTWVRFYAEGKTPDIAVLSVYDVLNDVFWGRETGLSKDDVARVHEVHLESTAIITGAAIPLEDIQGEYYIETKDR